MITRGVGIRILFGRGQEFDFTYDDVIKKMKLKTKFSKKNPSSASLVTPVKRLHNSDVLQSLWV